MQEPQANENGSACCQHNCDYTLAFWLLRGWLGIRAIVTGIEKFSALQTIQKPLIDPATGMEDPSGAMVDVKIKFYSLTNYSGIPAPLSSLPANRCCPNSRSPRSTTCSARRSSPPA